MEDNGNPNQLIATCLFMLIVGIIIYVNSLSKKKNDTIILKEDRLKNNFNSYLNNKGLVLIIFSSLFLLILILLWILYLFLLEWMCQ